jgi:hypothetical protein
LLKGKGCGQDKWPLTVAELSQQGSAGNFRSSGFFIDIFKRERRREEGGRESEERRGEERRGERRREERKG